MARAIQDIFDSMKAEGIRRATDDGNTEALTMFDNTSAFALWRLMFYVLAFAIWTFEVLMDAYQISVNTKVDNEYAHTKNWYRTAGLNFQYGFDLIPDTDKFDNTGRTADEIAASKIIKYCSVNETIIDGKRTLLIKIATITDGVLAPISEPQLAAFTAYMEEIKDAGVGILIYNRLADLIKIEVDFYYNPLLLDSAGARLDGLGDPPVPIAANNYLVNLPFNGEFSNARFVDALQNCFGAADYNVFLKSAQHATGVGVYVSIPNTFKPDAGYAKFADDGLVINYIPYVAD